MHVDDYSFGKIIVDGKSYTSDVIITPETVIGTWWRKEGHRLDKRDLNAILAARPDCLVVGTGYNGQMRIPRETIQYLESKDIHIDYAPTGEAIKHFDKLQKKYVRVVSALHLTC